MNEAVAAALRALPAIDMLLTAEPLATQAEDAPRTLLVAAARAVVSRARVRLRSGESSA